jgi:threonylcarbamoyladenosine tRNA methylthiotransferase MtaB
MKVAILTHGCKLNQYESFSIANKLSEKGYTVTENLSEADVVVFNSCTVTDKADKKAFKLIKSVGKIKRIKGNVFFIVTGCLAQTDADKIEEFESVDLVVGINSKSRIPEIVDKYVKFGILERVEESNDIFYRFNFDAKGFEGRTRAFLKIQDGCNRKCSFCKVPLARGKSVSLEFDEVIKRFKNLIELGYKEVVITGVNITNYNSNGNRLKELLKEMVKLKGEFRIRLSSIMPDEFDYEILEFMKDGKLAPHLHISIQSGSDYIIKLMKRGYTSSSLIELAERARKVRDDVGLTGDVIVGFPGETDEHFKQTLETVSQMGFFRLHVFPFSPRKGTLAATMPNQVPENVKKEREKILLNLVKELSLEFKKKFLGKYIRFIPEEVEDGKVFGYADNYLRIISNNTNLKHNEFEYAKIVDLNPNDMTSVIAD